MKIKSYYNTFIEENKLKCRLQNGALFVSLPMC